MPGVYNQFMGTEMKEAIEKIAPAEKVGPTTHSQLPDSIFSVLLTQTKTIQQIGEQTVVEVYKFLKSEDGQAALKSLNIPYLKPVACHPHTHKPDQGDIEFELREEYEEDEDFLAEVSEGLIKTKMEVKTNVEAKPESTLKALLEGMKQGTEEIKDGLFVGFVSIHRTLEDGYESIVEAILIRFKAGAGWTKRQIIEAYWAELGRKLEELQKEDPKVIRVNYFNYSLGLIIGQWIAVHEIQTETQALKREQVATREKIDTLNGKIDRVEDKLNNVSDLLTRFLKKVDND